MFLRQHLSSAVACRLYFINISNVWTLGKGPSVKGSSRYNYHSGVEKPDATACHKSLCSHEGEKLSHTYQEGKTGDSGLTMDKALVLGDDLHSCWGNIVAKNDDCVTA